MNGKNIRKHYRYASTELLQCKIKTEGIPETFRSDAINVSKNGLLLKADRVISENSELIIKLFIDKLSFIFKGKSIYCMKSTDGHYEIGMHLKKVIKSESLDSFYQCIDKLDRVDGPAIETFSIWGGCPNSRNS